jgi:hypothetical protein
MTLKQQLIKELDTNEYIVQIIPWDDLVKEWESKKGIAKTAANYASPVKDSLTATKLLREFGMTGKVVIKHYGGKSYVIFKGYPGMRKIFRGTRYLTSNPKVVRMAVGPKGIVKCVKGCFVLSVVLCAGVYVFDYFIRDEATLSELLGNVTSDIVKVGISSIAAVAAGLTVGSVAVISSVAAAPLIAAIAVGVATVYLLDKIDEKVGATKALIHAYEQVGIALDQTITTITNIPNEINREIYRYERRLINRAINTLRY